MQQESGAAAIATRTIQHASCIAPTSQSSKQASRRAGGRASKVATLDKHVRCTIPTIRNLPARNAIKAKDKNAAPN